jgi:hypothetical protein
MADILAVATVREALGDSGNPPAWSDAELSGRLDGNNGRIAKTVVACLLELMAEAAGRTDYTIGGFTVAASDVFRQLSSLLELWTGYASSESKEIELAASAGASPVAVAVEWVF